MRLTVRVRAVNLSPTWSQCTVYRDRHTGGLVVYFCHPLRARLPVSNVKADAIPPQSPCSPLSKLGAMTNGHVPLRVAPSVANRIGENPDPRIRCGASDKTGHVANECWRTTAPVSKPKTRVRAS